MPNAVKEIVLLVCFCCYGQGLYAQETTATLNVAVNLVEAMSLSVSRSLSFGEVVAGTGTVSIDRESSNAGKFVLQGGQNSTITVSFTMPANNQLVRAEGEGDMGLLANVYGSTEDNPTTAIALLDGDSVTLGSDGAYYFFVEGRLEIGPVEQNPAGTYSGMLTMTVSYQ